jgi:lipoate-protein ligase A
MAIMRGEFYLTPNGDAYSNMAMDEWLFSKVRHRADNCRAFLRLYSWDSKAITLGYNQDLEKVVNKAELEPEIPIIRRITGGRAICHDPSEITFSVIVDMGIFSGERASGRAVYRLISESLVGALRRLQIKAAWVRSSGKRSCKNGSIMGHKDACFTSVSRYEIVSDQEKIVGGAQRQVGPFIVHQGSMKANGICSCPAIGQVERMSIDKMIPGRLNSLTIYDFSEPFRTAFSSSLEVEFRPVEPIESEHREFSEFRRGFIRNCLKKRSFV